ncbi:hypothetical protein ACFX13_010230 [Malus domestica]
MYFQLFYGRTEKLKYQVTCLWLNQFNLKNNDTVLQYDLTIRVTVENPNQKSSYIMNCTEMVAFPAFDQTYLSPNSTVFHNEVQTYFPRFKGQRPVPSKRMSLTSLSIVGYLISFLGFMSTIILKLE